MLEENERRMAAAPAMAVDEANADQQEPQTDAAMELDETAKAHVVY